MFFLTAWCEQDGMLEQLSHFPDSMGHATIRLSQVHDDVMTTVTTEAQIGFIFQMW